MQLNREQRSFIDNLAARYDIGVGAACRIALNYAMEHMKEAGEMDR
jgi:hypothetical protein